MSHQGGLKPQSSDSILSSVFRLNDPKTSDRKPATGNQDQIPQKRLLNLLIYHVLRSGPPGDATIIQKLNHREN
jgi:hypothetical protein